jgi:polyisoprenoid-binding protein YceI
MRKTLDHRGGRALAFLILGLTPAREASAQVAPRPPASAAVFQVDTAASRVYIKVGASGRIGHDHGVEGRLASGKITLGETGMLVFAMDRFTADTAEARQYVGLSGTVSNGDRQKTNANMLGSDILAAAQYPTASYAIASALPLDGQAPGEPGRYKLDGQFTLHGVSRPQPLIAQVERTTTPGVLRMRCAFAIQQSEYGITPYSTLGGLVGVADRLDIRGDLLIRSSTQ